MPQYVLQPPAAREPGVAPVLDDEQRAVVEHGATPGSGPLLVLAGPGTGKTTTIVETVVERIERGGLSPDQVLVLTFSRKAADEVRGRIARRLARTTAATPAMTFHAFCYALLRYEQASDAYTNPLRLLSAPEQDASIAELLRGADPLAWPVGLRRDSATRGMATELQRLMAQARSRGMDAADVEHLGEKLGRDDWAAAGRFFDEYTSVAALQNTIDHTDMVFQAVRLLDDPETRDRWRSRFRLVVVDEYQDTDPLQVATPARPWPAMVATSLPWATPTSPSTGSAVPTSTASSTSPRSSAGRAWRLRRWSLRNTHRYGPTHRGRRPCHRARARVAGAGSTARGHEQLRTLVSRVADPGSVDVQTFVSATAEAEHVALLTPRGSPPRRRRVVRHGRARPLGCPPRAAPARARRGRRPCRGGRRRGAAGPRAVRAGAAGRAARSRRPVRRPSHRPRGGGGAAHRSAWRARRRIDATARPGASIGPGRNPSVAAAGRRCAQPIPASSSASVRTRPPVRPSRRAAGSPSCCARPPARSPPASRRAGALDPVERHRAGRGDCMARAEVVRRRARCRRTTISTRCAPCSPRRHGRRSRTRRTVRRRDGRRARGPADPGRHPRPARRRQPVGPTDDGSSLEGPGVAAGRRRRRPGRRMARHPHAQQPACRSRRLEARRVGEPTTARDASRRGATSVLRRVQPGEASHLVVTAVACRLRGGRPAVTVRGRDVRARHGLRRAQPA